MEDSCGRPMFRSGMMGLLIDDMQVAKTNKIQ
jgi:hypothetical protein